MKILVTGGNGQLARCIQEIAYGSEYDDYEFVFFGRDGLDITNKENVAEVLGMELPDVVINCAAYVNTAKAEVETEEAYLVNAIGPLNLAEKCNNLNTKLIHISTDMVFDGDTNVPYSEDSYCRPLNVYGSSKFMGESLIERTSNDFIIIRTSWLYSEFGDNFVKKAINWLKDGGEHYFVCDQLSAPTYAMNLAKFILHIITEEADNHSKHYQGIYHFTDLGVASRYDFAHEISYNILSHSGIPSQDTNYRVSPCEGDEFDVIRRGKYSVLSTEKVRNAFPDFKFMHWRTALKWCMGNIKCSENEKKQE